ncbi:MAG: hypothetical protein R3C99_03985 [Pirellulaceae bacterium]
MSTVDKPLNVGRLFTVAFARKEWAIVAVDPLTVADDVGCEIAADIASAGDGREIINESPESALEQGLDDA